MKDYNKIMKYFKKNIILFIILLIILFVIGSMINIKEGFKSNFFNDTDCDEYYNILDKLTEISNAYPSWFHLTSNDPTTAALFNRFQKVTGRGFDQQQDLKNIDPNRKAGCERGKETVVVSSNLYIVIGFIIAAIIIIALFIFFTKRSSNVATNYPRTGNVSYVRNEVNIK